MKTMGWIPAQPGRRENIALEWSGFVKGGPAEPHQWRAGTTPPVQTAYPPVSLGLCLSPPARRGRAGSGFGDAGCRPVS